MARINLNFAEVAAAFEKLLTQGEKPTAEKIQALLGKGTVPVIQKHLNHIFEQSRLDLTPADSQTSSPADGAPVQDLLSTPEEPKTTETTPANSEAIKAPAAEKTAATAEANTTDTASDKQTGEKNTAPAREGRRPNNKRDRNDRNNNRHHRVEVEEPPVETPLEQQSEEQLVTKIRQLESILSKEEMRREVAERITLETKDYADSIKEQVSQRINELKQNMDLVVEQLKTQLREQKQNFEQDLEHYQKQLAKANEALAKR